jgi:hypothetical protein
VVVRTRRSGGREIRRVGVVMVAAREDMRDNGRQDMLGTVWWELDPGSDVRSSAYRPNLLRTGMVSFR